MRHLVVGAGATLAEALALGHPLKNCPPLIHDFARKTWANYSPWPLLDYYLREIGCWEAAPDLRTVFYKLEDSGITNIEKFMEFTWNNRHVKLDASKNLVPGYISGLRILEGHTGVAISGQQDNFWDDLLYHGIGQPLVLAMATCFHQNGVGWRDLQTTKIVAREFGTTDMVLNLNYDTVFELALRQLGKAFAYAPNVPSLDQVLVCKPHGSLNMVANDRTFKFGQPDWLGTPQPPAFKSYSGLVPPRLNKQYGQHPIAKLILSSVRKRYPQSITFWGVGLTESDSDLIELYQEWGNSAEIIEIINPSLTVAVKARELFASEVRHYESVTAWSDDQSKS